MSLSDRQCKNRWKKKTYDIDKEDFFRRAPKKLKDNVKRLVIECEYTKHDSMLPSTIYECYRVDVSNKVCNELIDHYRKEEP